MPDQGGGYLGTQYPVPTDPNYYLGQTGLNALTPQAFSSNTLAAMFSPQGMQYTPQANMATNPFLSMFLNSSGQATKLQHKQVPGMATPGDQQQQQEQGMQQPGQGMF